MFFQNQIHHDSSIRKKAFNDNKYFDCRENPMDVFINFSKTINEIKEKRNKYLENLSTPNLNKENYRKKFRNLEVISLLKEFRNTSDLKEAEQLLKEAIKLKPGRGVHYYYNIFETSNTITHLYEKLILLKENHQKFSRAIKSKHNYTLCYTGKLSLEELVEVFGLKKIPRSMRNEYKSKYNC
jgi:hypothetical protein